MTMKEGLGASLSSDRKIFTTTVLRENSNETSEEAIHTGTSKSKCTNNHNGICPSRTGIHSLVKSSIKKGPMLSFQIRIVQHPALIYGLHPSFISF
jgi:hypothetical protein